MTAPIRAVLAGAFTLCLGACAGPAVYESAAEQGVEFEDAFRSYVDAATQASLRSRARRLANDIVPLGPDARLEAYRSRFPGLETGVGLHALISEHAGAMRAYFVRLQALAGSDAAAQSRDAAARSLKAVESIGGKLVADFEIPRRAGSLATNLVEAGVSVYQRKLLSLELAENGRLIEEQLMLQHAAVVKMNEFLAADLASGRRALENAIEAELLEPTGAGRTQWTDRFAMLALHSRRAREAERSADEAGQAAQAMVEAWRELVSNAAGEGSAEKVVTRLKTLAGGTGSLENAASRLGASTYR